MCGIAAIFSYADAAPGVDRRELARMKEYMRPRGPDGEGMWIDAEGRIGLAHRRLAIIDPGPAAAQPMHLESDAAGGRGGRLVITYNGEIYNFRALRAELEDQGRRLLTHSDTEVLLHLYDRDGPDMVHRLRGMFALAIWDEARRGLFLARDPFGIKPLYYADDGARLRLASQVKALIAGGGVDGAPDAAGHVGFFLFGYVPEPHTLHAQIRALPAGTHLWVGADGRRREERYFSPARIFAEAEGAPPKAEASARLAAALADSVRHHLVADVPVGVFLSAGLDSATITALASQVGGETPRTLTLAFDEFAGTPMDEAPLAERVAQAYGTDHVTRRVAGADFRRHLTPLLAAMDQPSIDGVNSYFVAQAAAERGLKVALSGLGGDELFAGYDSFRQIPALVRTLGSVPGLAGLGRGVRLIAAPVLKHFTSPKYAGLLEYGTSYGSAYLLRRGLFMPWELPEIMDPDMAREGWRALDPLIRLENTVAGLATPRAKVSVLELSWYMGNQLLRDADWAGMAHSLEIRTPLVDARLFGEVAALGADKMMMAASPAQALPDEVLGRPKSGFFVPLGKWLSGGEARPGGMRGWALRVHGAFAGTNRD